MGEWVVLSPSLPHRFDGIGDYAWRLADALSSHGPTRLVVRDKGGSSPSLDRLDVVPSWRTLDAPEWQERARAARGVLVQYMPPTFLRGDLRACLRWLDLARRSHAPIVLTVHEYWPPDDGRLRRAAVRHLYRRVLKLLLARASHVVLTQRQAAIDLDASGLLRERAVSIIPVGSNIDRAGTRQESAGVSLVLFGQPASMHEPTMRALGAWLRGASPRPVVTWINRSAEEVRTYWRERVGAPDSLIDVQGGLTSEAVSAWLSSASIGLAPYVNGASTRRTTLIALLQHGLPVVGLEGLATGDVLRESGALRLTPEGHPDAFVRALDELIADPPARAAMSAAAERVFREQLSWPCIARSYLPALRPAGEMAST